MKHIPIHREDIPLVLTVYSVPFTIFLLFGVLGTNYSFGEVVAILLYTTTLPVTFFGAVGVANWLYERSGRNLKLAFVLHVLSLPLIWVLCLPLVHII